MNLKMKPDAGAAAGAAGLGAKTIVAMVAAGVIGIGGVGWAISKAFEDPNTKKAGITKPVSADEARLAARGQAEKDKAQKESDRMKQAEVGSGVQFDAQGNMVQGPQGSDAAGIQNLALDQVKNPTDRAAISAGIQHPTSSGGNYSSYRGEEPSNIDPSVMRERREAKREERQEQAAPMLGYTTSRSVTWAAKTANTESGQARRGGGGSGAPLSDGEQVGENNRAISKLTALAERALDQQPEGPAVSVNVNGVGGGGANGGGNARRVTPAQSAAQVAEPGAVADMRVGGGVGPDMVVNEGKFLDCATVNRVESDINDSPVILQVTRDFVSPDGRYVLVPAGAKIYGVAGSVQSLQQARLYMAFHRIVYPMRRGENQALSAYFPQRKFPAMDNLGSLGVKDQVNRHFMLQFGAAIMLGMFDGAAASVQSAGATENPTMRDLVLARTSQNFANVVNSIIQRYANVVPTVTIREGKKVKVYFTQDVTMTPWMETRELSWVKGSNR